MSVPDQATVDARARRIIEHFPDAWRAVVDDLAQRMIGPMEVEIGRNDLLRAAIRDVLTRTFAAGFATGEANCAANGHEIPA